VRIQLDARRAVTVVIDNLESGTAPLKGTVLLSGASGMLGIALAKLLRTDGLKLVRLIRNGPGHRREASGNGASGALAWDPIAGKIDFAALDGIGNLIAAVHLSGANVASRRWTAAYKREMAESRIHTTRVLAGALARLKHPPAVLATASAVGFYGNRGDEILDESSSVGEGFFPELCLAWEAASLPAQAAGIRVVQLRFGMVIGHDGGAMARLAPLFKLGLGGQLGNGRQWMSWVSEDDAVSAVRFALADSRMSGAFNVTAPQPVTNAEFTRTLVHAVHRPAFFRVPAFALRLAFGEMADEALLASTRVLPTRLLQAGFLFRNPTLIDAFAKALTT
jgi:uncharacterized protein (TIGR01777 family)